MERAVAGVAVWHRRRRGAGLRHGGDRLLGHPRHRGRHQVECGERHGALRRQRDRAAAARTARGQAARCRRPAERSTKFCRKARSATGWPRSRSGGATDACSMRSMRQSSARNFRRRDALQQAWNGHVVAELDELGDAESARERAKNMPLLEIYSPIREPWSGEVVAVAEFYENASEINANCRQPACRAGWSWRQLPPRRWRCCPASCSAAAAPSSASARH